MDDAVQVRAVVFDLGGVLIDWNPRHLYRKIFASEDEVEYFLSHVCTRTWHEQQDAGQPAAAGTAELAAAFPEHRTEIEAFYGRFGEMLGGPLTDTVRILEELRDMDYPLFALSNWPAETFPEAEPPYGFLNWFDGIVVSGREQVMKPNRRIFEILCERYHLTPTTSLFVDDVDHNISAARALGFQTHHFTCANTLREDLAARGMLPGT